MALQTAYGGKVNPTGLKTMISSKSKQSGTKLKCLSTEGITAVPTSLWGRGGLRANEIRTLRLFTGTTADAENRRAERQGFLNLLDHNTAVQ